MQSDGDSAVADAGRIGELLKQARQKRGLVLGAVAAELHLQQRQLEAMEEGNFSLFVNPVFVKGHLRACAGLYGIDPDGLVRLYESLVPVRQVEAPVTPSSPQYVMDAGSKRVGPQFAVGLVVLVAALFAFAVWWGMLDEKMPNWPEVENALGQGAPEVEAALNSSDQKNVIDAKSLNPPVVETPEVVEGPLIDPVSVQADPSSEQASSDPVLHLQFVDDCWVQIKSAEGKVLHEQLHRQGEQFELAAAAPLHVWLGNGNGVHVTYNGVVVPVSVRPGFQSARFIIDDAVEHSGFE